MLVTMAARRSPLSLAQVEEVRCELNRYHPEVRFDVITIDTTGDKDRHTSLRSLSTKSDFFTREIDEAILSHHCRVAIHSAKDLADPIAEGVTVVAVTRGVDSSDALVLRQGTTLENLPRGAVIATSSVRREEAVKALRSDLSFIDLRGTIHERLSLLEGGVADGVVIAEAALIRLSLTHLTRVRLPGTTAAGQGRLAICAHTDDAEMAELFACLKDERRNNLIN